MAAVEGWEKLETCSLVTGRGERLGMQMLEHLEEALAPRTPEEVAGEHVMQELE